MYAVVGEHVFPFLRNLGGDESTYAHHMKDARFTIPHPGLLARVVDMIDKVPMEERDTKGDLYEYMLAKIASAGQNGQFRSRVTLFANGRNRPAWPTDIMCDPACGTCGFLVAVGEYLRQHPEIFRDPKLMRTFIMAFSRLRLRQHHAAHRQHEHAVARRGDPDIRYRDSLAQDHAGEEEKYTLVPPTSPFAGSLDYENSPRICCRS